VSKALGNAVVRNRMKRRMREAVRLHLGSLPSQWWIVFNPRKPLLDAEFVAVEQSVVKLFEKCGNL
jgi:ribonuclease P protein component